VIGNVPAPADAGLKVVPLTPVPLYVPPDGDPPVRFTTAEFEQTGEKDDNVTDGPALTVIEFTAEDEQLFASVYV
jgi:hypothetical protein